jgi:hypothetical protein
VSHAGEQGRKECRASAWAGQGAFLPSSNRLKKDVNGTGREREGCCGQQHEGGRAHPFDPRHDPLHEILRKIVQPLGLCATTRASHVLS